MRVLGLPSCIYYGRYEMSRDKLRHTPLIGIKCDARWTMTICSGLIEIESQLKELRPIYEISRDM